MQLTQDSHFSLKNELPQVGLEPATFWADALPTELPRQLSWLGLITHTKQHNSGNGGLKIFDILTSKL